MNNPLICLDSFVEAVKTTQINSKYGFSNTTLNAAYDIANKASSLSVAIENLEHTFVYVLDDGSEDSKSWCDYLRDEIARNVQTVNTIRSEIDVLATKISYDCVSTKTALSILCEKAISLVELGNDVFVDATNQLHDLLDENGHSLCDGLTFMTLQGVVSSVLDYTLNIKEDFGLDDVSTEDYGIIPEPY